MKKKLLLASFIGLCVAANAQNIGIGTALPNASALLDVTATNKGMLVPRVTNAQMNAIASPANGLLVYNTDSAAFAYRNATAWVFIKGNSTASNDWSTKGNAGTNAATNFIGTTDNTALRFRVNNLNGGSIDPIRLNTFLGGGAGNLTQTGVRNVGMGFLSLADNSSGEKNIAIGVQSLRSNTTGSNNTAVGYDVMYSNYTGNSNTAFGDNSLSSLVDGNNNVAIGLAALYNNLSGNSNVALGSRAGYDNTGSSNVFLGYNAGSSETGSNKLYIQNSNTAPNQTLIYGEFDNKILSIGGRLGVGATPPNPSAQLEVSASDKGVLIPRLTNAQMNAIASPANGLLVYNTDSTAFAYRNATAWVFLKGNTTASNDWSTKGNAGTNPAINFIGTTDNQPVIIRQNNTRAGLLTGPGSGGTNTGLGVEALNSVNIGSFNTALGVKALYLNTDGINNTATGVEALSSNENGNNNTANGVNALRKNKGSENTAIGMDALFSNTTGNSNTATGRYALYGNTTGNDNTATGLYALLGNSEGYSNVAIGTSALASSTNLSNLVAIGDSALYNNGSGATQPYDGIQNVAVGSKALYANTVGLLNTAVGFNALLNNISGDGNTAIGNNALLKNTAGNDNIAIGGDSTLAENLSGFYNVAIGSTALFANNSGSLNTAVGHRALYVAVGSGNTALGYNANAGAFHSGSNNVFLGREAGYEETGSNRLYISNGATNAANTLIYGEFDNKILSIGGRLGIGNTTPHGDLHLPQTLANRKIVLLEDFNNDHQFNGFGINTFIMRYQAAATTSSHVFYVGTSAATSTELMRITGNGEVGIGKIPLISNNDSRLQIKQKGIQNGIGIEAPNSTNHWDYYVTTDAASNLVLYYNGSNKGTFDNVTGAYTANSDRRLKKDITPQAPVLNNLAQLQAYQYHYLDNQPTDRFSNGFMAQDVQKIFPDAVVENTMKEGQTRLGINYQYFTVLAIKGLQEQQQQIDLLKQQMQLVMQELEKIKTNK